MVITGYRASACLDAQLTTPTIAMFAIARAHRASTVGRHISSHAQIARGTVARRGIHQTSIGMSEVVARRQLLG